MRRLASWLPVVVWMAVMTWFSTADFDADTTGTILFPLVHWLLPWASDLQIDLLHLVVRKGAHLTEYGILAALWLRALAREGRGGRRAPLAVMLVAVVWAFADELHQAFEPTRTARAVDVVIDATGAAIGLIVARLGWRRCVDAVTAGLLWIAAVAGAAVLAVDVATGVGAGLLWLTVPAAVLALVFRWRKPYSRS